MGKLWKVIKLLVLLVVTLAFPALVLAWVWLLHRDWFEWSVVAVGLVMALPVLGWAEELLGVIDERRARP